MVNSLGCRRTVFDVPSHCRTWAEILKNIKNKLKEAYSYNNPVVGVGVGCGGCCCWWWWWWWWWLWLVMVVVVGIIGGSVVGGVVVVGDGNGFFLL